MEDLSPYQAVGGAAACRKLADAFYARVGRDPVLRPLFPGKTFRCAIEEFSAFLVQFLDGPAEDSQRRWWLSLRESHLRFRIGKRERDAWMRNMVAALDEVAMEESCRSALRSLFERSSAYLVNADAEFQDDAKDWGGDTIHEEVSCRWDAQRVLDDVVAAVRRGQAERAIALSESLPLSTRLGRSRTVLAALLGVMIGSKDDTLLDYVRRRILADPGLVQERYSGRTLLHGAAAAGSLGITELLLDLGANPNVLDDGGHAPLYCLANECRSGGEGVVAVLVHAGAKIDACDGVKHCTALHMAARRGNSEMAGALLDCGANLEARDSAGDTPLRRAVNCNQTDVAKLLLLRGADVHSVGSKRLTPWMAARTNAMRQVLAIA